MFAAFLVVPSEATAPSISSPDLDSLVLIGGDSLLAFGIPIFTQNFASYAVFSGQDDIRYLFENFEPKLAKLLYCMWGKESSLGKNLIGDKGKGIGHFQIWISLHPVSYECAMDFKCSLNWTAQKIKEGKGYLWTSYKTCKETPRPVRERNYP